MSSALVPYAHDTAPVPVAQRVQVGLEHDDTLATLHSRLENVAGQQVTLAVAPGAHLLRRPLDFQVLRRLAEELGLEVIVEADGARRQMARAHGFATQPPRGRPWWPRLRVALVLLAVLSLAGGLGAALPRAVVTVEPASATVAESVPVTVDLRAGAPGVTHGWVASQPVAVTFEAGETVPASGQERVGHLPARGYVTFHDTRPLRPPPPPPAPTALPTAAPHPALAALVMNTGAAPAVPTPMPTPIPVPTPLPERVLPAGTVVLAQDGTRFLTTAEVRLQPGSYANAEVTAEQPGVAGNLPAGALTHLEDPALTELRVENRLPTWGGTDRTIRHVAAEDRARLSEALHARAAAEAPRRLSEQAGTDLVLLADTATWTIEEQYDRAAGQRGEVVGGRGIVRAQAVAVPRAPLAEVAGRGWETALPRELAAVEPPALAGAPSVKEQSDDYLLVTVPMHGAVTPRIQPAALAESLRGQPLNAVRDRLARIPGLNPSPRVEVWPTWAPAALRVEVVVASVD